MGTAVFRYRTVRYCTGSPEPYRTVPFRYITVRRLWFNKLFKFTKSQKNRAVVGVKQVFLIIKETFL